MTVYTFSKVCNVRINKIEMRVTKAQTLVGQKVTESRCKNGFYWTSKQIFSTEVYHNLF